MADTIEIINNILFILFIINKTFYLLSLRGILISLEIRSLGEGEGGIPKTGRLQVRGYSKLGDTQITVTPPYWNSISHSCQQTLFFRRVGEGETKRHA